MVQMGDEHLLAAWPDEILSEEQPVMSASGSYGREPCMLGVQPGSRLRRPGGHTDQRRRQGFGIDATDPLVQPRGCDVETPFAARAEQERHVCQALPCDIAGRRGVSVSSE